MSDAAAPLASPWRPFASAAYFLAVLLVLAPAVAFAFATWPPNPLLLSWRHVSSDMLISTGPMIGSAAVVILLAAKVRGDVRVLGLLRSCALVALALSVPFGVVYTLDTVRMYGDLPEPQAQKLIVMEIRMFTVMAVGLVLLWMFGRAARSPRQ